jgi:PAS domain S-box-containing protein
MALSRPQAYEGMSLPVSQMRSGSNEGQPVYAIDQQHHPGSYGGHYGMQGAQHGGYQGMSNETGWTERVLDEMKDMLLLLTPKGQITYATRSCKNLTGRAAKQLEGSLLSQYIHEDDQPIFQRDMDDAVTANHSFRTHLRFQKINGTYCLMEAYGHPHIANQNERQVGRNSPIEERCTGYFLICRPYPNKISQLLDSFLEHKIENARLIQQIAKLKQEEDEEATAARPPYKAELEASAPFVGSGSSQSAPSGRESSDQESHSPETLNPNSDDSDTNQSAEYYPEPPTGEVYSHIDGIEVMTGLYYGDGERSQGLSTGVNRGRLVHCDIDITTAADQERNAQEGDRRKRLKGQHVCGDCGTADSPEWRKGPSGPKTLCNACGCKFPVIRAPIIFPDGGFSYLSTFGTTLTGTLVRWSKKEKKRQEST